MELTHREWSGIGNHTQELEEHPVDKDLGKGALKAQMFQSLLITTTKAHHVNVFVSKGVHQSGGGVQYPMSKLPVQVDGGTVQLDGVKLLSGR